MKKNVFKTLSASFLIASSLFASNAFAADKKSETEKIEVTPTENVSQQELATIYVLSEICPDLIDQDSKFDKAYENLAKAYLDNKPDATALLKKQVKSKDFKASLKEARKDAKAASDKDNREICHEVVTYYSK